MSEPIQNWFRPWLENTPDEMYGKSAAKYQVMFVRDDLCRVVADQNIEDYHLRNSILTVISEHTSKSITLPVYSFDRSDIGLRLVLRNNFYDWKLSVISDKPIIADFKGLFVTDSKNSSCYFEGFPEELVLGSYEENNQKFSAEIYSDYQLWTVLFLIMRNFK